MPLQNKRKLVRTKTPHFQNLSTELQSTDFKVKKNHVTSNSSQQGKMTKNTKPKETHQNPLKHQSPKPLTIANKFFSLIQFNSIQKKKKTKIAMLMSNQLNAKRSNCSTPKVESTESIHFPKSSSRNWVKRNQRIPPNKEK